MPYACLKTRRGRRVEYLALNRPGVRGPFDEWMIGLRAFRERRAPRWSEG